MSEQSPSFMKIEAIEIRNYRVFRDTVLTDLPRMAVVVGANGSGKSTLFDVFSFLRDALTQNVAAAVARRGGFRELVSRGETGPIGITLKFRGSQAGPETHQIYVLDDFQLLVRRALSPAELVTWLERGHVNVRACPSERTSRSGRCRCIRFSLPG